MPRRSLSMRRSTSSHGSPWWVRSRRPIAALSVAVVVLSLPAIAAMAQDTSRAARPDTVRSDTTVRRRRPRPPTPLPEVEVRASPDGPQRPLVDRVGATTGGALDSLDLRALPTDGRDPLALAFTIPGVAQATGFFDTAPILSIDGQNSLYTQYFIDGLDNNEGVLGGPRVDLPIDALSLVDVRANAYGVDLGRSSNGVVNYITRSGTDTWHGDAFIEGRPGHGFDAPSVRPVPDVNTTLPGPLAASFRRMQAGGAGGGPVVRGKTHVFGAFEYSDESQDQPIVTSGFTGGVGSAERVKYKAFARLDQTWSSSEQTTVRIGYSNEDFIGNGGGYVVPEADNVQHRIGAIYALSHRSGAADGALTNIASAQVATYHWFYPPSRSALTEPTVLLMNAADDAVEAQLGSSPFQYDEHETQVNLRDMIQWHTGAHRLQLGGDMVGGTFRLRGSQTSYGGFYTIVDSGGIHQTGRYLSIGDIPAGYPVQSWAIDARPQRVDAAQTVVGAFVQDQWRAGRRLTVIYGVRWDYDDLTSHGAGQPDFTAVQPRASFNWAVTPASALRGGAGIYAGKLPYTIYSDALQFGPSGATPVLYNGTQAGGTVTYGAPPPPASVNGSIATQPPREIRSLFALGLKSPRSYQATLGYQVAVARTWGLSVDGVMSYTFDLPRLWDVNADPYQLEPSDVEGSATAPKTTGFGDQLRPMTPQNGSFRSHTTTNTGGTSHYFGLYTTLRHQLRDNWTADLTWVWSHAQDNTEDINFAATQGNNFAAEWADAINDRRHKIDLRTTYTLLDHLQLSGIADYQTGQPMNWVSGLDLTGAGPAYGDGFVRNTDRYYGIGRNAGRLPDAFVVNLGVGYLVTIARQGVELRADALNVLNRVNESGFPSGLAGVDPRTQIGMPGRDPVVYAIAGPPRQIQLAVRYRF
jgi:hypothetical protein